MEISRNKLFVLGTITIPLFLDDDGNDNDNEKLQETINIFIIGILLKQMKRKKTKN